MESLSSYARQFMGRKNKPDVDYILGISPAVAIEQKVNTSNPRSTVGTSTEIYEYLKLLFARIGHTFSPVSGAEVKRHSVSDVVDFIYSLPEERKVMLFAPLHISAERSLKSQLEVLKQEGFVRVSLGGTILRIEDFLPVCNAAERYDDPMLLIDRIPIHHGDDDQKARVAESVQTAFFEGHGACAVVEVPADDELPPVDPDAPDAETRQQEQARQWRHDFSNRFEADGITFEKPNPNFFSFNKQYGDCPN